MLSNSHELVFRSVSFKYNTCDGSFSSKMKTFMYDGSFNLFISAFGTEISDIKHKVVY